MRRAVDRAGSAGNSSSRSEQWRHRPEPLKVDGKFYKRRDIYPSTRYQPKLADKMAKYVNPSGECGYVAPTEIKVSN
jgi:hypothetical protein